MTAKTKTDKKLRILFLEDLPQDIEIIGELLTDAGFDFVMDCTEKEREFISWLRDRRYDIILSDFKLPEFDGFTALKWVKEICPHVPLICVSGVIGEETAVEVLKMGAVDYVLKDRLQRLPHAIKRALDEAKMQASVAQADRLAIMGMLAAGVAHEINNPLTYVLYNLEILNQELPALARAIKMCCSALKEKVGESSFLEITGKESRLAQPAELDDLFHSAQEAFQGTRRIMEIARALSTFSRSEKVAVAKIELKAAIQNAISMATNEIKYRAQLVTDFKQLPPVMASDGKLSQVFLNLLINAAQSIEEGNVQKNHITIRTWAKDKQVFIEIADTGKGIPPENLERIFEPFFTTKPLGEGSGLGLAICKNIISGFNGDIRVVSDLGKGSSFIVRLPMYREKGVSKTDQSPSPEAQVPPVRGRVLVIDDETEIRWIMQRVLEKEHDIVTADSGEEARRILEKDRSFDLILCDLIMPHLSGMDLHAWLSASDRFLADRMIFISGGAFTTKAAEFLSSVPNLRIEKPVESIQLKRIVAEQILKYRRESK